jgi:hypothetical protein
MDLDEWLRGIPSWAIKVPRRAKFYREKLEGIRGVVEIGYARTADLFTAAYYIQCGDFDRIFSAKGGVTGILTLQCGNISVPNAERLFKPEDPQSLQRMVDAIAFEAPKFFCEISSLSKVHRELVATSPRFPDADPRGAGLRHLFAAITAFLLGLDWEEQLELARSAKGPLSEERIIGVEQRIRSA